MNGTTKEYIVGSIFSITAQTFTVPFPIGYALSGMIGLGQNS